MELKGVGRGLGEAHLVLLLFSTDHFPLMTGMLIVSTTSKRHRLCCNYTVHKEFRNRLCFEFDRT